MGWGETRDILEESSDLVLLLELELGGVHHKKGNGTLVADLEVEVWWIRIGGVKT